MKLRILDEATAEFAAAIARYESIESGLGLRMKQEVRAALEWIEKFAEVPRLRPKGYRRMTLKVFPYYLAYMLRDDTIWVLAIAHSARLPEYWIDRKR